MTTKIIVCVTTQGAIGSLFEHGLLRPCQKFDANEAGQRAFGEFLRVHHATPVYLMADLVEEDYHTEVLPHVSGAARQELVQRRLKQVYRNTAYYTAWIQGREPDKRRDDRYLFAALTNTDMLRPWLDVLSAHQAPLAGITLLPLVSQTLVSALKLGQQDVLLISKHHEGLRQSFFQSGQLRASRLAVVGMEIDAAALAAEISKTRLYLNSLRLVVRETRLTVLLLDSDDTMEGVQQRLQADSAYDCQRLTRQELSACLKSQFPGNCPYASHMTVLGMHHPAQNLAPPSATRGYWRHQQRRVLYGASSAVIALSLAWAGVNIYQKVGFNEQARQLSTQTQDQLVRYVEVTKTFPQSPTSADNLEKAVQIADQIRQDSLTPELVMQVTSRALETNPEVTLLQLSWKNGLAGESKGKAETAPPVAGLRLPEWAMVEGEIRPFHGDYRAAMASINRFADKLRHDPDVDSVSVTQMPLNVHSASALSGNTLDTASGDAVRAEFKLKLVLRARQ